MDVATLLELLRKTRENGELPLYKTGRLEGLVASRQGQVAEAAQRAIADGLLEIVRSENKGKATVEWVRVTPKGRHLLIEHESPRRLLEDVAKALQVHRDGQPHWVADLQAQLRALSHRLDQALADQQAKLAEMHQRVATALERLERGRLPAGIRLKPWQSEVLAELEKRRQAGEAEELGLAELHAHLRTKQLGPHVAEYHDGLQQLATAGLIQLIEAAGALPELAEPEFVLIEGRRAFLAVRLGG